VDARSTAVWPFPPYCSTGFGADGCQRNMSVLSLQNNSILTLNPSTRFPACFDVSLTVNLSITLDNDQLDAQIFHTFITIFYMYMFRAISCSSSAGQIVLIQHLVSSLAVSDDTRCCINTIWPVEDEQDIAQNMYT
jgi:hypothetical protein